MNNTVVVGIGEILWDIFPERKVLGGAPANFAYHVSQFGFNGCAVSAIGNDLLGREVLESLAAKELNYLLETTGYPTGTVMVELDGKGVPTYDITENVAWDNIPWTDAAEHLARSARAVCFGSLAQRSPVSRETIRRFVEAMPDDSLRIFDINLRQNFYSKELVEGALQAANILKLNEDEAAVIADMFSIEGDRRQVCRRLMRDHALDIVILTLGTDGSWVFCQSGDSFQPTPRVHVADTVGAGDSFTAAFTAALLEGLPIAEAHQLAAEVSAYVCQQNGAMPRLADAHRQLFNKPR